MGKLPKKLRTIGFKLSISPQMEELLNSAAARIEELEKKLKKLQSKE
jgi:hypothetical protein